MPQKITVKAKAWCYSNSAPWRPMREEWFAGFERDLTATVDAPRFGCPKRCGYSNKNKQTYSCFRNRYRVCSKWTIKNNVSIINVWNCDCE